MSRHSALRASDADRERVAERLRHATAEGRLVAEELEERLGTVFSARTYGELDGVLADLPAEQNGRPSATPLWVKAGFAVAVVMALLAVMAVVALILVGLAGAWLLWVLLAWMFLGRRGRACHRGHSRHGARSVRRGVPRARVPGGRPAPFV